MEGIALGLAEASIYYATHLFRPGIANCRLWLARGSPNLFMWALTWNTTEIFYAILCFP
jgi:hypothetical protein